MTCIVGIETRTNVVLGADSCNTFGMDVCQILSNETPKVFQVGGYAFGFSGDARASFAVMFGPKLPCSKRNSPSFQWVSQRLIPLIRETISDAIPRELKDAPDEYDDQREKRTWTAVVGVKNRLYQFDHICLFRPACGYTAIGCADMIALGALHATKHLLRTPRERIEAALVASQEHGSNIRPPWVYAETLL